MKSNPLKRPEPLGPSIWMDHVRRHLVAGVVPAGDKYNVRLIISRVVI